MGTTSPDLYLALDRRPRGLRAQVEDEHPGGGPRRRLHRRARRLPSTRALAADLGVTRRVVVEAYDQLVAEGYLSARQGAGTVGERRGPRAARRRRPRRRRAAVVDFRPGPARPRSCSPAAAWARRSPRGAPGLGRRAADDDRRGLPALRTRARRVPRAGPRRRRGPRPDRRLRRLRPRRSTCCVRAAADATGSPSRSPATRCPRDRLLRAGRPASTRSPVDGDGLVVDGAAPDRGAGRGGHPGAPEPDRGRAAPAAAQRARRRGPGTSTATWSRTTTTPSSATTGARSARCRASPPTASSTAAPPRKTLAPGLRLGWMVLPGRRWSTTWSRCEADRRRGDVGDRAGDVRASCCAPATSTGTCAAAAGCYRRRRDAVVAARAPVAAAGDRRRDRRRAERRAGRCPTALDEQAVVARAAERGVRGVPAQRRSRRTRPAPGPGSCSATARCPRSGRAGSAACSVRSPPPGSFRCPCSRITPRGASTTCAGGAACGRRTGRRHGRRRPASSPARGAGGPFQAQQLLVAQRGQAGRGAKSRVRVRVADRAAGPARERQRSAKRASMTSWHGGRGR